MQNINMCVVKGCVGTSQLVKFPRNEDKCQKWLNQLGAGATEIEEIPLNNIRKYFRICINHFEEKYFEKLTLIPKKLLPNAIPTLHMFEEQSSNESSASELDDANYIDIGSDFQTCFTNEYKFFKRLHSPNLQVILNKAMVRMPPRNRHCVIQFDFLPIRTEGEFQYPTIGKTQVLVFMLKGLYENWKQLLAYVYVDRSISLEILAEFICDGIHSALSLNFNVLAIVCAPDSSNIEVMDRISNNRNRIYYYPHEKYEFVPFPYNKRILILYDVPRLLVKLRMELMVLDFCFKDSYKDYIASWTDIETVHEFRKQEKCQVLTDEHVYLTKIEEKSVRHPAQVFSSTVAESLLDFEEKYPEDFFPTMIGTSKLLSFFNDLFDSLNGYQYKAPEHKPFYKKVRRGTEHYLFWQKSIKYLDNMFVILWTGELKRTTTLEKWQSTIYGIMELWNTLLSLDIFEFVPRRLHMDALDNDLSRIRYHNYYVEGMKWNATLEMKKEFFPDMEEFDMGFRHVLENGANFLTPLYSTFLSVMHSTRSDLDFEKNSDEATFNCLDDNCSTIVAICDFAESIKRFNKLIAEYCKKMDEINICR